MAKLFENIYTRVVNHADWWKDYMTEMSILIISLAATFYGESLIQGYQEDQDDNQTMMVVVNELEGNVREISEMLEYYHNHLRFSDVLKQKLVEHKNVATDTIQGYNNFHRLLYYWTLKKNALNMMRESGTMQRMENRDLLTQIIDSYEWINIVVEMDSQFRRDKKEQLINFVSKLKEGEPATDPVGQWEQIDQNLEFKRFLIYAAPLHSNSIISQLQECMIWIQKTIEHIKQEYDIKDAKIH